MSPSVTTLPWAWTACCHAAPSSTVGPPPPPPPPAGDVKGMRIREALEIAIQGGARNLGRDDIGQLAPGFAADFAAWNVGGGWAQGAQL